MRPPPPSCHPSRVTEPSSPLVPRSTIAPPPDAEFEVGAKNAVVHCLAIRAGERVAIVTHPGEAASIAEALRLAAKAVGADVDAYVLSLEEASQPAIATALVARLASYHASFLVSTLDGLPVELRRRVVVVGQTQRRHGHLIGITPAMMSQSMRADYGEVDRLSVWLATRLVPGASLHATAPGGTDLRIRLDAAARVGVASGVLLDPGWTNLPGGEVFALPSSVDGVLVPDGGVWDPDGAKLTTVRTKLTFERGEVTRIEGPPEVCARLESMLDGRAGARRAGQIGFGTNTGVLTPIGALLQDLKVPGFHLTLGHTCPEVTGARWDCDAEIPLLVRRASVSIEGEVVLAAGRYPRLAAA
jgi:leucyl aminopeptidase (aminopeptidase T)